MSSRKTPLHLAVEVRDFSKVQELLENEDDVARSEDDHGRIPLHLAAAAGQNHIIRLLLDKDAKQLNLVDENGQTPLHLAIAARRPETVQVLLGYQYVLPETTASEQMSMMDIQHEAEKLAKITSEAREIGRNRFAAAAGSGYPSPTKIAGKKVQRSIKKEIKDCVNCSDNNGQTPLHLASGGGSLVIIEVLIRHGARKSIGSLDRNRRTPLHVAASTENDIAAQTPPAKGAKETVDWRDKTGQIPSHLTTAVGKDQIVQILLENGAKGTISWNDFKGQTALHLAAAAGRDRIVQMLLENRVKEIVNWNDFKGQTALHLAAAAASDRVVQILLENGAKEAINWSNLKGQTALHLATAAGRDRVMQILLKNGAGEAVNWTNFDHETPLHLAITAGKDQIIQTLLENGAKENINLKNLQGQTPLHLAAAAGDHRVVQMLLENGAKETISLRGYGGRTPLHLAVANRAFPIVQELLSAEAARSVNSVDTDHTQPSAEKSCDIADQRGDNPLHLAAASGDFWIVCELLRNGASVNLCNKDKQTPLLIAAMKGHESIAELLIAEDGIDLDYFDGSYQTALSYAAWNGQKTLVNLLFDKGAQMEVQDFNGWLPLENSAKQGHWAVMELLLERKCVDVNFQPPYPGRTLLSYAAEYGRKTVIEPLLEKGARVDVPDRSARTPLSYATEHGHKGAMELLLEKGARVSLKDRSARTPLSYAVWNVYMGSVIILLEAQAKQSQNHSEWQTELEQRCTVTSAMSRMTGKNSQPSNAIQGETFSHFGEGFTRFRNILTSFYSPQNSRSRVGQADVLLTVEWEVVEAMQLYKQGAHFSSIFTISGDSVDAQAAICGNYIEEHFSTGPYLMHAVQAAWNSENGKYIDTSRDVLDYCSIMLLRSEQGTPEATVAASGTSKAIREIACAFAWFCCALRPSLSGKIAFSTFLFTFNGNDRTEKPYAEAALRLQPLRQVEGENSCWHDLFKRAIIVLDAPISDRSQFKYSGNNRGDLSVPRGLDIPFDIMVNFANVDYPFEYDRGIVLKGFHTLLVVTSKWVTGSESAFQWHFAHSEDEISLSKYTDAEKYYVWEKEEKPRPELEIVRNATRTFLGWNDAYEFDPDAVNPSAVAVTSLPRAGKKLSLKSIAVSATVGKAPITAGATLFCEIERDFLKYTGERKFLDIIEKSEKVSTLIYVPNERRGWLVPRLWVLVNMARVYAQDNSLQPMPPKVGLNLIETKANIWNKSEDILSPKRKNGERIETFGKSLKDIICDLADGLDWAENNARHQRKWAFGPNKIYGFEFFELATRQKDYFVRECSVKDTHGGWIRLLSDEAISGVIFCKGLGEIINCGSTRCLHCASPPRGRSYLTAVVCCLQNLKKYGRIPGGGDWEFRATAFEGCSECSSCSHRLQDMKARPSSPVSSDAYPDGVVVFGKSHRNEILSGSNRGIKRKFHGA